MPVLIEVVMAQLVVVRALRMVQDAMMVTFVHIQMSAEVALVMVKLLFVQITLAKQGCVMDLLVVPWCLRKMVQDAVLVIRNAAGGVV
jgi:hypothetical protein